MWLMTWGFTALIIYSQKLTFLVIIYMDKWVAPWLVTENWGQRLDVGPTELPCPYRKVCPCYLLEWALIEDRWQMAAERDMSRTCQRHVQLSPQTLIFQKWKCIMGGEHLLPNIQQKSCICEHKEIFVADSTRNPALQPHLILNSLQLFHSPSSTRCTSRLGVRVELYHGSLRKAK